MELKQNQREWDELAEIDPMWAILSDLGKRDGGWQEDEFSASGAVEIAAIMQRAAKLGLPCGRAVALDFGCGLGRLSRPLAQNFDRCIGLDISARMVRDARALASDVANVEFILNPTETMPAIADASIDFVYSNIVLQHVSSRAAIRSYLAEFARVLAPGGLLVFQLPSFIPRRHRLQPRPRVYSALRRLGVPGPFLYFRLRLQPIRMRWLAVDAVRAHLASRGLRILQMDTRHINTIDSTMYFVARADDVEVAE